MENQVSQITRTTEQKFMKSELFFMDTEKCWGIFYIYTENININ